MAEFRWIKTNLFFILVLQFTGFSLILSAAATGQRPLLTVRAGDDVTLSCENKADDQVNCDGTTWLFRQRLTSQTELVNHGQLVENTKSDRLNITEKCSLVMKKVTDEDAGYYSCIQDHKSEQQSFFRGYEMSVLRMTERQDTDEVTLNCSVRTYERCPHTVKWLFQGQDVDKDNKDIKTSQSPCSASVTFLTSLYIYTSRYKLFTCAVTDGDRVQVFPFRSQSSGEDTTTAATTESATTTENNTTAACTAYWSALDYIMLVMRVAELLLITVITVLLIRASGNQRPPDDNTVNCNANGQDVTVNYENVTVPSVSVRLP
ncbi:uncharacterized protein LOC125896882 [Epinephelus fuscoguttatus]|uniref:uncharacterized protein LOC125896882 n=1 Tax=Epinephelus fuscoguttatus TaxID=293821 RepID=UPI0020D1CC02|nr:uncharacterized protein LOC125896882 [Epinephelus fuscoguttatus]